MGGIHLEDESAISKHGFEWRGVRRRPTPTTIRVNTPLRPRLEEEQTGRKFEALKKYVNGIGQNIKLLFKAIDQQSWGREDELVCDPIKEKAPLIERMGKVEPWEENLLKIQDRIGSM